MAKRAVCDGGDPCTLFERALSSILSGVEVPTGMTFEARVVTRRSTTHSNMVLMSVRLQYCPFCGTRIDPADWAERRRGR